MGAHEDLLRIILQQKQKQSAALLIVNLKNSGLFFFWGGGWIQAACTHVHMMANEKNKSCQVKALKMTGGHTDISGSRSLLKDNIGEFYVW